MLPATKRTTWDPGDIHQNGILKICIYRENTSKGGSKDNKDKLFKLFY